MQTLECVNCNVAYPGLDQCPVCYHYLVVPDRRPPNVPTMTVGDGFSRLWSATVEAAQGRQPAQSVVPMVRSLEKEVRYWSKNDDEALTYWALATLDGLSGIAAFATSRSVSDLNQAWVNLVPAAANFRQRFIDFGQDMGPDEPEEYRSTMRELFMTDTVTLSDPDE